MSEFLLLSSDHHRHPHPNFARALPRGMTTRLAEQLAVEETLLAIAQTNACRWHVRLGDLFHTKQKVDSVVYGEIARCLKATADSGIQNILLRGNHDAAAGGLRHTLEAFGVSGLATVIDKPETLLLGEQHKIRVTAVPYDEDGNRQRAVIADLSTDRGSTLPQLLWTHIEVAGATTGSEFRLPGTCALADLHPTRFDLVHAGHVHRAQRLAPNVEYIGTDCQQSFADEGCTPQCLLLNLADLSVIRVPLPGPTFTTVRVGSASALAKVKPIPTGYYRILVTTRDVKVAAVDRHFDGRAAGWQVQHAITAEAPAVRLAATTTAWPDLVAQYVAQATTELDKARLTALGQRLVGVEVGG